MYIIYLVAMCIMVLSCSLWLCGACLAFVLIPSQLFRDTCCIVVYMRGLAGDEAIAG